MPYHAVYLAVEGALICPVPEKDCLDWMEINKIASHTVNTWQKNRGWQETLADTAQGKMAEFVLENYLEKKTDVRYLSYDKFRADEFRKHAPFDGLIYSVSVKQDDLNECIRGINSEVANHSAGQISEGMRERLEACRIFTLEIKSSKLREKDYQGVEHVRSPRTLNDYKTIIANIKKWDYFVYPFYTRRSDQISSFYEYAEFVRQRDEFGGQGNQAFLRELILKEFRNASDIYTRLYFDGQSNEIVIPGYMLKENFYRNPKIGKMPGGKSGKALYYMRGIAEGSTFVDIDHDKNIWEFDRLAACSKLFAYRQKACPHCGRNLQICNVKARGTYSYRCFDCGNWFTMEQLNENQEIT